MDNSNTNTKDQEKIDIVPFDKLESFPENTNYLDLFRSIADGILESNAKNYTRIIQSLNNLRRLKRYNKEGFIFTFDILYEKIERFIISQNPDVAKISLIFVAELFSTKTCNDKYNRWIKDLLPAVLDVAIEESSPCKELALICLNNCANYMFFDNTIKTLFDCIQDKDDIYAEFAHKTLKSLFINFEKQYLCKGFWWEEYFGEIVDLYSTPRRTKYAQEIVKLLEEILSPEQLNDLYITVSDDLLLSMKDIFHFNYSQIIKMKNTAEELHRQKRENLSTDN